MIWGHRGRTGVGVQRVQISYQWCDTHTTHSSLFVPGCENTGSWPSTLQHPPQEETTLALPVALKQRPQVPCRSPVSFVLTAGRKASLAWGHWALGNEREYVCVCATFSVVGVCRGFARWGHMHLLAGFPPLWFSQVHKLLLWQAEWQSRRKLQ